MGMHGRSISDRQERRGGEFGGGGMRKREERRKEGKKKERRQTGRDLSLHHHHTQSQSHRSSLPPPAAPTRVLQSRTLLETCSDVLCCAVLCCYVLLSLCCAVLCHVLLSLCAVLCCTLLCSALLPSVKPLRVRSWPNLVLYAARRGFLERRPTHYNRAPRCTPSTTQARLASDGWRDRTRIRVSLPPPPTSDRV